MGLKDQRAKRPLAFSKAAKKELVEIKNKYGNIIEDKKMVFSKSSLGKPGANSFIISAINISESTIISTKRIIK